MRCKIGPTVFMQPDPGLSFSSYRKVFALLCVVHALPCFGLFYWRICNSPMIYALNWQGVLLLFASMHASPWAQVWTQFRIQAGDNVGLRGGRLSSDENLAAHGKRPQKQQPSHEYGTILSILRRSPGLMNPWLINIRECSTVGRIWGASALVDFHPAEEKQRKSVRNCWCQSTN